MNDQSQVTRPEGNRTNLLDIDTDVIDIRQIVAVLLSSWPYVLGLVVIAYFLATFKLFNTPSRYRTDALVQVEQNTNAASLAFSQTAEAVAALNPVSTEIAILQSRSVLGEVVRDLSLNIVTRPVFFPVVGDAYWRHHKGKKFGSAPFYLRPFNDIKYSWGGESIAVTNLTTPESVTGERLIVTVTSPTTYTVSLKNGVQLLAGTVGSTAKAMLDDGEFQIFVRSLMASEGQEFFVVKQSDQVAIDSLKSRLSAESSRFERDLITLSLRGTDREQVAVTLNKILQVYQGQNVRRRAAEAQKTLEFLDRQLPELESQVETAESKLNQFKVDQGSADLAQETSILLEESLTLEKRKRELQQQVDEALQRYTANHPVVQGLQSQINRLSVEIDEVGDRIGNLPDLQQQALRLTRDAEIATSLYLSLLNRSQELQVVKSGTVGNIRIIDEPVRPLRPFSPKAGATYLIYMAAGALVGIFISTILFLLRNGVEDPVQVERALGLATYGSVPYSFEQRRLERKSDDDEQILALTNAEGPAIESLRSVRTAIHFAQFDTPNNIMMVTGPEPNIGKSFVATNLAAVMAMAGQRVLLIDADMRRGHLHKGLHLPKEIGLSEVLSGQIEIADAIKSTQADNLDVITSGKYPPNPSELLLNRRLIDLLDFVGSQYDHVILDTPPVLAVTDASILGKVAGIVMMVVKSGAHPMRMIEDTVKNLNAAGVRVNGTIFNQVGRTRMGQYGYRYGAYGGYHYQYKYSRRAES